jgi:hypothetical protein
VKPSLIRKENQMRIKLTLMKRLKNPDTEIYFVTVSQACNSYTAVALNGFSFRSFVGICADSFKISVFCAKASE